MRQEEARLTKGHTGNQWPTAAGAVGSFVVQIAKWKGARIIATASRQDFSYLKSIGAEQIIDYKSEKFDEKIQNVDVVIDLVGGETLARSFLVVRKGGTIVTTVGPLKVSEAEKREIRGVQFFMKPNATELAEFAKLVEAGILKPRVSQILPLEAAMQAQDLSQTGQSHGKIVLQVM